jgi:hypothetical protein
LIDSYVGRYVISRKLLVLWEQNLDTGDLVENTGFFFRHVAYSRHDVSLQRRKQIIQAGDNGFLRNVGNFLSDHWCHIQNGTNFHQTEKHTRLMEVAVQGPGLVAHPSFIHTYIKRNLFVTFLLFQPYIP